VDGALSDFILICDTLLIHVEHYERDGHYQKVQKEANDHGKHPKDFDRVNDNIDQGLSTGEYQLLKHPWISRELLRIQRA